MQLMWLKAFASHEGFSIDGQLLEKHSGRVGVTLERGKKIWGKNMQRPVKKSG
jgi:hypothetical protein